MKAEFSSEEINDKSKELRETIGALETKEEN